MKYLRTFEDNSVPPGFFTILDSNKEEFDKTIDELLKNGFEWFGGCYTYFENECECFCRDANIKIIDQ